MIPFMRWNRLGRTARKASSAARARDPAHIGEHQSRPSSPGEPQPGVDVFSTTEQLHRVVIHPFGAVPHQDDTAFPVTVVRRRRQLRRRDPAFPEPARRPGHATRSAPTDRLAQILHHQEQVHGISRAPGVPPRACASRAFVAREALPYLDSLSAPPGPGSPDERDEALVLGGVAAVPVTQRCQQRAFFDVNAPEDGGQRQQRYGGQADPVRGGQADSGEGQQKPGVAGWRSTR